MVTIEYRKQVVDGEILRSVASIVYRARLQTQRGYFLAWVPFWKILGK